ncbi:hypothetical protein [Aquiflexum sp.]|uniref:hypothetical protein n=1 Tax=Aquiflexum sp. TaxID=1872584 RepID=UPI003594023F
MLLIIYSVFKPKFSNKFEYIILQVGISKTFGSYVLVVYIFLLMGIHYHQGDSCEHHNTDHTEHHEGDTSDEPCCPPFAPCKLCSLFFYESAMTIEIPIDIEFHQFQNIIFKNSLIQVILFPFWHPPQSA